MTQQSGDELHELTMADLDMVSGGMVSGGSISGFRRSVDASAARSFTINPSVLHALEGVLNFLSCVKNDRRLGGLSSSTGHTAPLAKGTSLMIGNEENVPADVELTEQATSMRSMLETFWNYYAGEECGSGPDSTSDVSRWCRAGPPSPGFEAELHTAITQTSPISRPGRWSGRLAIGR